MPYRNKIVVVIPAYNEASTIYDVATASLRQLPDVIVVDDGSSDETSEIVSNLPLCLLCNQQNMGKAYSLWRGLQFAVRNGAQAVITLDGDGQHQPDDIPRLIKACNNQADKIIIAARMNNRKNAPPLRRFANAFADFWVSWASGFRIKDSQSGFRLYPASLIRQIDIDTSAERGFVFESEILIDAAHLNIPSESIAIDTIYHEQARHSHYKPTSDTTMIVKMIAGKLIRKGMYPAGLMNVLQNKNQKTQQLFIEE